MIGIVSCDFIAITSQTDDPCLLFYMQPKLLLMMFIFVHSLYAQFRYCVCL